MQSASSGLVKSTCLLVVIVCVITLGQLFKPDPVIDPNYDFSSAETSFLRSFHINQIYKLPLNPQHVATQGDKQLAKFGYQLFFDKKLSASGDYACANCHKPDNYFTDGKKLAKGVDERIGQRNTPTVVGLQSHPWFTWDGRADSLWAQALMPIENKNEQSSNRAYVVRWIQENYRTEYEANFGVLPADFSNKQRFPEPAKPEGDVIAAINWSSMFAEDQRKVSQVFANVGRALMAYEQSLWPNASRFDRFVEALSMGHLDRLPHLLSNDEVQGLKLFMGEAGCAQCHHGPLLTNSDFHNLGIRDYQPLNYDFGRAAGARQLKYENEFNCLSEYSLVAESECSELRFLKTQGGELVGAFKTPSLRNVALTAPYMHAGQLTTLTEVVNYYNKPTIPDFDPRQVPAQPHSDLEPLQLTQQQVKHLVAFLHTLTSEKDVRWEL